MNKFPGRYSTREERDEYIRQMIHGNDSEDSEPELDSPDDVIENGNASDVEEEDILPDIISESSDDSDDETIDVTPSKAPDLPFVARDGTEWNKEVPSSRRALSHNIIKKRGGPHSSTAQLSLLQTFKCFFSEEMCNIIIRESNRKASKSFEK